MPFFRKKPIVIEAHRWHKNGDHPRDYDSPVMDFSEGKAVTVMGERRRLLSWEGEVVRFFRHPEVNGATVCKHCGNIMDAHGWIDTPNGGHTVCPGDWVITGVNGEHYPCKPDVFAATYDAVEQDGEDAMDGAAAMDALRKDTIVPFVPPA